MLKENFVEKYFYIEIAENLNDMQFDSPIGLSKMSKFIVTSN